MGWLSQVLAQKILHLTVHFLFLWVGESAAEYALSPPPGYLMTNILSHAHYMVAVTEHIPVLRE